ncbi:MAG: class I SAM-dependent methyltransferase [Gammaproteobacteria bacterium]|nr:class I SAM-dependent methyltransferase [Gammaproteobacteria bacterium]MDH3372733.1 class I SAM-dependent methyltransferase [Gammaproteobacteria bacterium]MDH3410664.1 class I SAM-dependent methyltransferase [Gammaproteobacteria bacterium]MDH3550997.1 class I SAM-dependent methyltransferase [Gammaproteobacteria bacterium]
MSSKVDDLIRFNRKKWNDKNLSMYQGSDQNLFAWNFKELDPDYRKVIDRMHASHPLKICDLGTCSGEQAIEMAKLGHDVTGTDVSEVALEMARRNLLAEENAVVFFAHDDVLDSRFADESFDLITDRGCFHSMHAFISDDRYIASIRRLLKPGGLFFVKGMSQDEERFRSVDVIDGKEYQSPYHFREKELDEIFGADLEFIDSWKSFFYSSVVDPPAIAEAALFRKP